MKKCWMMLLMMILFFRPSIVMGASPTHVQTVSGQTHTAAQTFSMVLTSTSTPTAPNALVAAVGYPGTVTISSVTDTEGNTFTLVGSQLNTATGNESSTFYTNSLKAGSDTVTVTFSGQSSFVFLLLSEYLGQAQSNIVLDTKAGAYGPAAGAVSSGNGTTTAAGDLIYGYCHPHLGCSAGTGFTTRSPAGGMLIEDMAAGAAGSYAATGTATGSWTMQMAAFKYVPVIPPAPIIKFSPTSLSFPAQTLGTVSSPQVVTMTNSGNAPLTITGMSMGGVNAGEFSQTNNCGTSLAAGASCTINISFAPVATRSAVLSFTDNATGSPQGVNLSGTASGAAGVHTVVLQWTPSATIGVVGYNIFRGTVSGGESSTPLNSAPINASTWTDTKVTAGQTYFYVATAIASDGITQSPDSNEASATVPTP